LKECHAVCSGLFQLFCRANNFKDHFFTFADHKRVDKIGHGFWIVASLTARDDKGMFSAAFGRQEGDPSQVKHVQGIGVEGFVGKTKANNVKLGNWML